MQIEEHRFDTGVVTLNYAEIVNEKPALVMLHGGSAQWDSVEVLMVPLSADFHIFVPGLLGHGKSGWVAQSYTLVPYTQDICYFLENCVESPAILFGHSLGGIIALMVASKKPELLRAVIVGDSPLSASTWVPVLKEHAEKIIPWRDMAGGRYTEEEIEAELGNAWVAHNLVRLDPDTHTILIDEPDRAAVGYENVLPHITCPVLLLQADPSYGGLMTNEEVTAALNILHQPSHILLKGVSHILQNEDPKIVEKAIREFLSDSLDKNGQD